MATGRYLFAKQQTDGRLQCLKINIISDCIRVDSSLEPLNIDATCKGGPLRGKQTYCQTHHYCTCPDAISN